ncbi:MAG: acyl-CoA dehydrogenase family protein [Steroidobacteraceae bacterium]
MSNPPASDAAAVPASPALRRDLSAARSLFMGQIVEENLFPYPQIRARDREILGQVVEAIDGFLDDKQPDFRRWDVEAHQPDEFIQGLRDMGLFGLIIPEEHGGLELSNGAYARVLTQTSSHDASVSLTVGAHSSIGMKGLILFGTPQQKARYLPKLASGEYIAAFCLTESGSGSDAASIRTHARRNADGSWTLNGEKIWITNGGIAQFYTVFARTDDTDGKITAFLVEAAWQGVGHGPHEDKMGIRASSTTVVSFADVRVPAENVLGEPGKGFKVAMGILNSGRTGLGGGAVGGMKTVIRHATRQASERRQFGQPIANFGLVREKIGQMMVDCFAAESTVWMLAHYIDAGVEDYATEAAISKVFASEAIQRCAHEGLQIAAGNGFMREFPYEQIVRDSRILSIFEGTNEILRLFVALSGLKDAGKTLAEIKSAVDDIFNDPIKGFGVLSSYAGQRLTQATGVGRDRIASQLPPSLAESRAIYEKYALELGKAADFLLRRYGKSVVDRQYDCKRLADVAIDLFVGLCSLSRAASLVAAADAHAAQAVSIAALFAQQAKRRMAGNIRRLTRNEDAALDAIAGFALERGAYPWDVI